MALLNTFQIIFGLSVIRLISCTTTTATDISEASLKLSDELTFSDVFDLIAPTYNVTTIEDYLQLEAPQPELESSSSTQLPLLMDISEPSLKHSDALTFSDVVNLIAPTYDVTTIEDLEAPQPELESSSSTQLPLLMDISEPSLKHSDKLSFSDVVNLIAPTYDVTTIEDLEAPQPELESSSSTQLPLLMDISEPRLKHSDKLSFSDVVDLIAPTIIEESLQLEIPQRELESTTLSQLPLPQDTTETSTTSKSLSNLASTAVSPSVVLPIIFLPATSETLSPPSSLPLPSPLPPSSLITTIETVTTDSSNTFVEDNLSGALILPTDDQPDLFTIDYVTKINANDNESTSFQQLAEDTTKYLTPLLRTDFNKQLNATYRNMTLPFVTTNQKPLRINSSYNINDSGSLEISTNFKYLDELYDKMTMPPIHAEKNYTVKSEPPKYIYPRNMTADELFAYDLLKCWVYQVCYEDP